MFRSPEINVILWEVKNSSLFQKSCGAQNFGFGALKLLLLSKVSFRLFTLLSQGFHPLGTWKMKKKFFSDLEKSREKEKQEKVLEIFENTYEFTVKYFSLRDK